MKKAFFTGLAAFMLVYMMGGYPSYGYGGYGSGGGWYLPGSQGNDVAPGSLFSSNGGFFSSVDTYRYPQQGGYYGNPYGGSARYGGYPQYNSYGGSYQYQPTYSNYGSPTVNVLPYLGYQTGGYGNYYGGGGGWYY